MKKTNRLEILKQGTEIKQIHKILNKYLSDFSKKYNFVISRDCLWKFIEGPVEAVIGFDTSSHKKSIYFIVYILPLFVELNDWTHFRIKDLTSKYKVRAFELRKEFKKFDWSIGKSDIKNSFNEILDIISNEGIAWVSEIATTQKLIQFLTKKNSEELNYDDYEVLAYCYLWEDNFKKSKAYIDKAIEKLEFSIKEAKTDWQYDIKERLLEFKISLEKDYRIARKILEKNITATVLIRKIPTDAWGNLKDIIENNLLEAKKELTKKERLINTGLINKIKSNRIIFEKEMEGLKTEEDWNKFIKRWFNPTIWPHRRHEEALDELHKRKVFMKAGFEWYPFVSTIKIPQELHFEYIATIDTKNKMLNVNPVEREVTYFVYFNSEHQNKEPYSLKEGRKCAYCFIYVKSTKPQKCSICGRKLFFTWVMED